VIIKSAELSLFRFGRPVFFLLLNFNYEKVGNTSLVWVFDSCSKLRFYRHFLGNPQKFNLTPLKVAAYEDY